MNNKNEYAIKHNLFSQYHVIIPSENDRIVFQGNINECLAYIEAKQRNILIEK